MVFGRNMIDPEDASIDAPRDSDAWILALNAQFPGSFLPFGQEQIVKTAARTSASSRLRAAGSTTSRDQAVAGSVCKPSWRKTLLKARLVPRYLTSSNFRLAFTSGVSANSICFERELLDHFRLVLEKT